MEHRIVGHVAVDAEIVRVDVMGVVLVRPPASTESID